jgi:hypothetical protein
MKGTYEIDQTSPGFSVFILLFFTWFRLLNERYLQSKACILIEGSSLTDLCPENWIYFPDNDMLLIVDSALPKGLSLLQGSSIVQKW